MAYSSDESGRLQVYARAFPSGHRRVQISSEGGGQPRWSAGGREIFYVSHSGTVMTVPVSGGELRRISGEREPQGVQRREAGQRLGVVRFLADRLFVQLPRLVECALLETLPQTTTARIALERAEVAALNDAERRSREGEVQAAEHRARETILHVEQGVNRPIQFVTGHDVSRRHVGELTGQAERRAQALKAPEQDPRHPSMLPSASASPV